MLTSNSVSRFTPSSPPVLPSLPHCVPGHTRHQATCVDLSFFVFARHLLLRRFMNQDIVAGPPNFSWYCGAVIHIPNPSGPEKGPVPVGTVCFLETGGGGGESLSLKEHEAKKLAQFAEDASLLLTARCVPRTSKRVYAQAENPGLEADSELGVLQEE